MSRLSCGFYLMMALVLAACGSVALPTRTPSPLPTASSISPALLEEAQAFCPLPRGWVAYVTQPGDTLPSLAERTSSSSDELAFANCLQNPGRIDAGVVFYLPRQPITP